MKEQLALLLLVLLSNVHWNPKFLLSLFHELPTDYDDVDYSGFKFKPELSSQRLKSHGQILLADAKGVAGLGKAGGEGQGGADKAGQQVPPEVYMALTYAGTLFLFTLSVPLILYGLNKLLNKIEDCFGCGPSTKKKKPGARTLDNGGGGGGGGNKSRLQPNSNQSTNETNGFNQQAINSISASLAVNSAYQPTNYQNNINHHQQPHPESGKQHQHQLPHHLQLQMLQQYPKYTQFISMSNPDYNPDGRDDDKQQHQHQQQPSAMATAVGLNSQQGLQYPLKASVSPPSRQASANNSYALNMSPQIGDSKATKT